MKTRLMTKWLLAYCKHIRKQFKACNPKNTNSWSLCQQNFEKLFNSWKITGIFRFQVTIAEKNAHQMVQQTILS